MSSIVHELTVLQEQLGWLPESELRALSQRLSVPLHRLESVSTFYTHFRRTPPRGTVLEVCRDLSCAMAGSASACASLRDRLAAADRAGEIEIREVSCLGRCDSAPAMAVGHRAFDMRHTERVLAAVSGKVAKESTEHPASTWGEAEVYAAKDDHYATLRDAVARGPSHAIVLSRVLEESGLRGMGGAGFPTGRKWALVASEPATPKYVICNADESEPGTFKDRQILHDLPHLVIEGMALAARCVGAEKGWVFIRHEYGPERVVLERAIAAAYQAGALGKDIFGSGFSFDVEVFVSPGGYILGEETALLECMEDRRGEPRNKPPYPGTEGLCGKPTLMNNVETFAHATAILNNGVEWWNGLGKEGFRGHKFISVSGDVKCPGVVLVPFGTTLGELLKRCGGMQNGKKLLAVAPGGASSNFLPAARLDVPLDFKTLADAGSMLGSGAAVFVAEGHDLLEVALNVTRFFRNESCGKCVPCRVGSEKAVAILENLQPAAGVPEETRKLLCELNETLVQTSICGLGQVALGPLTSILSGFPDAVRRA